MQFEFAPKHAHPFSVADAATLDVGTIVGEITRLQNSLAHLSSSQAELLAFLREEEDADLRAAWAENEEVIASQQERITLLKHVLVSKVGQDSLGHYGIDVDDVGGGADAGAGALGAGGSGGDRGDGDDGARSRVGARIGTGGGAAAGDDGRPGAGSTTTATPAAPAPAPPHAETVGTVRADTHTVGEGQGDDEGGLHL